MIDRRLWTCRFATVIGLVLSLLLGVAIYEMIRVRRVLVDEACGLSLQRIIPSPNAKNVLVTFEAACGATTPFSTQAAILPAGARFSPESYPPFFVVRGRHELAASWAADDQVEITAPHDPIYRQDANIGGVFVRYR